MNLVSHKTTTPRVNFDGGSSATTMEESLPAPLAEIAVRTESGWSRPTRGTKRPRARPKRPRPKASRLKLRPLSPGEVVVGTLVGINDAGDPLVRHPLDPSGRVLLARTTVPIVLEQVDRKVVLAFESSDPGKPIVLGVLHRPDGQEAFRPPSVPRAVIQPIVRATLDDEQLVLTARNEIVLRCGKASLTLTRAGKILIRGTYLLSRSSGVNRVKGGSVQIN